MLFQEPYGIWSLSVSAIEIPRVEGRGKKAKGNIENWCFWRAVGFIERESDIKVLSRLPVLGFWQREGSVKEG